MDDLEKYGRILWVRFTTTGLVTSFEGFFLLLKGRAVSEERGVWEDGTSLSPTVPESLQEWRKPGSN